MLRVVEYDATKHSIQRLKKIFRAGQREIPRVAIQKMLVRLSAYRASLLIGVCLTRIVIGWVAVGWACCSLTVAIGVYSAYFLLTTERYIKFSEGDDFPRLEFVYRSPGKLFVAEIVEDNEDIKIAGFIGVDAYPEPHFPPHVSSLLGDRHRISETTMELRRLAVDPQYRRLRVGTMLVDALLEHATKNLADAVFLTATQLQPAADALYTREGFEMVHEFRLTMGVWIRAYYKKLNINNAE